MHAINFLHLTDLHLGDHVSDPGLHTDTVATMGAVRRMIEQMDPQPVFIAVSGDLTNRGDPESYRILREMMDGICAPVLYALGNHDSRPAFYSEILGHSGNSPYDHDIAVGGVHVITLDSSVPGRIGGALEDRQFAFLDTSLTRHPDLPKLLMVHHPPALEDAAEDAWERLTLADSARLGDAISGRNLIGILSGHIHRDRVSIWRGVPLVVALGQHCEIEPVLATDEISLVTGASFARGVLRGRNLAVTFTHLPSDRRELGRVSTAAIRSRDETAQK
jgi:3',5'-cyclic AMP phosphodiesterase CpdA